MSRRIQSLLAAAAIAVALVAFLQLGPGGELARAAAWAFAIAALAAFVLMPGDGRIAQRGAASLGLGALGAAIAWLALEQRAVLMTVALYFVLWWTLLFAVLPFGVRSQHEAEEIVPGSDPGAPVTPRLLRKAFTTSVVAAVALLGVLVFLRYRPIPNILPFG